MTVSIESIMYLISGIICLVSMLFLLMLTLINLLILRAKIFLAYAYRNAIFFHVLSNLSFKNAEGSKIVNFWHFLWAFTILPYGFFATLAAFFKIFLTHFCIKMRLDYNLLYQLFHCFIYYQIIGDQVWEWHRHFRFHAT